MGVSLLLLILFPLALLTGSVMLRIAISIANRRYGPLQKSRHVLVDAHDEYDENDWSDYPIESQQPEAEEGVIPRPTVGGGMMIVFTILIVNGIITFVFQMMMEEAPGARRGRLRGPLDDMVLTRLLSIPMCFLLTAALLAALLPTNFIRACWVAFYQIMFLIAIAVAILAPMFFLGVVR